MYAPTDFGPPDEPDSPRQPMRRPLAQERLIGLAALVLLLMLCLLMSLSMDSDVFHPYNTARAITQTAAGPGGVPANDAEGAPQATWVHPTIAPRPTRTPINPIQSAQR